MLFQFKQKFETFQTNFKLNEMKLTMILKIEKFNALLSYLRVEN